MLLYKAASIKAMCIIRTSTKKEMTILFKDGTIVSFSFENTLVKSELTPSEMLELALKQMIS